MNRAGKASGGGFLLLFGVVLLLFVAQYVATKPAVPAATQAISRFVKQDRRQTAIGSQETKEGYVIDPALAQRMRPTPPSRCGSPAFAASATTSSRAPR